MVPVPTTTYCKPNCASPVVVGIGSVYEDETLPAMSSPKATSRGSAWVKCSSSPGNPMPPTTGPFACRRKRALSVHLTGRNGDWVTIHNQARAALAAASCLPWRTNSARRLAVPIGIVAIAQGATSVREWLPKGTPIDRLTTTGAGVLPVANGKWESNGELFQRLTRRFAALGPYGFRAVLWHQGESDAGQARSGYPAERQISGDDYVRYMRALIEGSQHAAGWNVPWITAVTTYHSEEDAADAEFRTAQKSLSTLGLSHEGPDTDTLRAEFRDGVHFNEKGLRRHGAMWAEKVANWLDQSLKLHTAEDSVIRFDGRLDEPLWKRAAIVRDFSFPWSDKPAPATEFRSTVLGDRLYFAFTVVDNDLIVVTDWINESTLNGEDRVEVFFARDAELKEYYCIEIDPLGRVHDYAASFYRHFDSQWNCPGLQTSARRTSEGYVVEAAVPLAALTDLLGKPIAPGTSLRVGLFRAEFHGTSRGESGDDWLSHVRPATELPDFHVPSAFRMWAVPN